MQTYFPKIPSSITNMCGGRERFFSFAGQTPVDAKIKEVLASKRVYLSTKQVPTCLAVRCPGSHSLTRKAEVLRREGFPIDELSNKGNFIPMKEFDNWDTMVSASQIDYLSSYLSSVVASNDRLQQMSEDDHAFEVSHEDIRKMGTPPEDYSGSESSESESESESHTESGSGKKFRIRYQDAFGINAALVYAGHLGIQKPEVFVWEGDVLRLTDKIPSSLFRKVWGQRRPVKIPFFSIADPDIKIYLVKHRTYWGKKLSQYVADQSCEEHGWAVTLWKRIKHFLRGRPDPRWNRATAEKYYGPGLPVRDTKKRAARFLQLLLTVDGIFQQRYLSDMGELWNWEKFDNFTLMNLSLLIGDEFIDGEIPKELVSYQTAYASLKGVRQKIKEYTHLRKSRDLVNDPAFMLNPFARILSKPLDSVDASRDRFFEMRNRGILSQTRGAGTPPPLVAIQAKKKLLETLMQRPPDLTATERILISGTMKEIVKALPDEAFTGLRTKAGIRASTASCFEKTRAEGGSAQAINDIVYEGKIGRRCRIYDLETGTVVSMKYLHECTPGEYIFWRCLEEVLCTDLHELSKVYALVVSEPGKARSVTKGLVAVKVVLDVVNGICSWPVHKAFPSSTSGMSKEAHGWNLFRAFETEDFEKLLFTERTVRTQYLDPTSKRFEVEYQKCFSMSTDFETATDFMHHQVAGIIGNVWMRKVGIPPLLIGIVNRICFCKRRVIFTATGCLDEIGSPVDKTTREIEMERGVLMGDPLTKVILHLVNICARSMGSRINSDSWASSFMTNAMSVRQLITPSVPEFQPAHRSST